MSPEREQTDFEHPVATAGDDPPIVQEARRLIQAAGAADVPVRLVGGLAVRLHAEPLHPAFAREYKDVDLVTVRRAGADVGALLESLGYVGAPEFNALNGHRRLMYGDEHTGRRIDVFVGEFRMCHSIPITERIERDPTTLPLAELLLTKLQIVELNDRDALDAAALLHHHDVADHDEDAVNAARVAEMCAADWGLWRTTSMNLERVGERIEHLAGRGLTAGEREAIRERLAELRARIDAEPKPRAWRLRDRVGDRKRWYELPEEVED
jgi:hypothetical protein